MRSSRNVLMMTVSMMAALSGCAPSDDESPVDAVIEGSYEPTAAGTTYEPPSGRNGLKPAHFWSETAQVAYRDMQNFALKSGAIIVGGVELPLLRAPSGSPLRALLKSYPKAAIDLIECALDPSQVVYDSVTGTEIHGWWGLAPDWYASPLSGQIDKQEWLTGCMLSRLNAYGIEVPILVEGDTPAIQTNAVWDPLMPYQESTVLGNMFNSTKPINGSTPAFDAYVCRENYLASICTGDGGTAYVNKRICDNVPALCGLIDIGACDPSMPGSLGACSSGSTPEHWKCKRGVASTILEFRTVGVQLEYPISQSECY